MSELRRTETVWINARREQYCTESKSRSCGHGESPGHWPGHSVVANNPGRAGSGNALGGRLLPWMGGWAIDLRTSTAIRLPRWARWCWACGVRGVRAQRRCRSCSACARSRRPRAKASLFDDVWRQLKQAAVKFRGLRSRRPPLPTSVTTWHGSRFRATLIGVLSRPGQCPPGVAPANLSPQSSATVTPRRPASVRH
jgi:hypothetical protein